MLTKIIDSVLYLVHYNLCVEIVEFIIASNKIFLSIREDNHCTYTLLKVLNDLIFLNINAHSN